MTFLIKETTLKIKVTEKDYTLSNPIYVKYKTEQN